MRHVLLASALMLVSAAVVTAQPIPDLQWEPEPFRYESGTSQRYIDYENGDDSNPGTREEPWKHHPWDQEARGKAAASQGIHTYVFKQGVVYRGQLAARESGEPDNPIRLTLDPDWGHGEAAIAGAMKVTEPWKPYSSSHGLPFPESSAESIWYIDLAMDLEPKLLWVIDDGDIVRIPVAREPDWTVTNPDDPMAEWWEWTDHKCTGFISVDSTEGFAVGDRIWIAKADKAAAGQFSRSN